jgi:hypothetical protein
MKKILIPILILLTISCKKDIVNLKEIATDTIPQTKIDTTKPTINKVGFVIDTVWFKKNYPGFWIETHNGKGEGDFNKDGRKDLVVMFATNTESKYLFQKDTSSRVVVGVFINHKTYFELDTNLVYSYLGGYSDISVADINNDNYIDIYQMTGYWEGSQYPKPTYYNNSGHGGMDSYVYLNDKNKSLKRYTLPNQNDGGSTTSIIFDNNKNGFSEIYLSSCLCYFEFNGNSFIRNELSLDNTFKNERYNLRVITPKYADNKSGVIYIAENDFGNTYFILKVEGNKLTPKIKYQVPYAQSGPSQEIYVEDLNKDGKLEYIIPTEISSNSNNTKPAVPYLMIVDENGNDVSKTFMDEEITKPLSYEQINWVGETWQTGFIYHTFADIDNDGIKEIFPASGIGYKKGNDTYYYKFIDGKYKLQFYHSGWLGDVHKSKEYTNYKPFVDEKNGVNIFLTIEYDLYKSIFKTF